MKNKLYQHRFIKIALIAIFTVSLVQAQDRLLVEEVVEAKNNKTDRLFENRFFVEVRNGGAIYSKKVTLTTGNLSGNFSAINAGVGLGYQLNHFRFMAEYNPSQKLVVENEQAKVESIFFSATYWYNLGEKHKIGGGGFVGHNKFELYVGPSGQTFSDGSPTAKGVNFGLNLGYIYDASDLIYIKTSIDYGLNKFDGSPVQTNIEKIEIDNFSRFNLTLGFKI